MDEYEQMVQQEIERAKEADKDINNNIRGNYMNRLGVHTNQEQNRFSVSTNGLAANNMYQSNHDNGSGSGSSGPGSTVDTFNFKAGGNSRLHKDELSPSEVKRTTLFLGAEGKLANANQDFSQSNRNTVQLNNLKGYFNYKSTLEPQVVRKNNHKSQVV